MAALLLTLSPGALGLSGCAAAPIVEGGEGVSRARPHRVFRPHFAWPATLDLRLTRTHRRAETLAGRVQRSGEPEKTWRWRYRQSEEGGLLQISTGEGIDLGSIALSARGEVREVEGLVAVDRRRVLRLWTALVTLWEGRVLEVGQAYQAGTGAPGSSPGVQLIAKKEGPCLKPSGDRCLWLEALLSPSSRRLRARGEEAARGFIQGIREALPEADEITFELESVRAERHAELVTGASTLVPRTLTERSYLRLLIRGAEGSAPIVSEVVEETRWSFVRIDPG